MTSANPTETTSYWVRVFGTEGFATDSDTATITPATDSDYDTWASTNITAGLDATRTGDPDGDSLPNLLEFALGLDPLTADAEPLTITQTTATYTRPQGGAKGVTYTLQFSSDLSTWTPIAESSVSPVLPDTEIVQHLFDTTDTGFVRISVAD
jgi:hypothetical protein